MTNWAPAAGPDTAARRALLLQRARDYFANQRVMAVDTPALSSAAPSDPSIEPLSIEGGELHLHTSPEFAMKRLLAGGYPDIYSICRVFRHGEQGRLHLPEFTMIEWYRRDMALAAIVNDSLQLVSAIMGEDVAAIARHRSYVELFAAELGIDPLTASIDELGNAAKADRELRDAIGDDRDAWLDLLVAGQISQGFATDAPTVVKHYPASQAALARICPDDPRVADRFEIFWGELEIANGYVELVDVDEQSRRIQQDIATRRDREMPIRPRDDRLLAALAAGLPACAGVALGFERLHMIDAGADDIRNVVSFVE